MKESKSGNKFWRNWTWRLPNNCVFAWHEEWMEKTKKKTKSNFSLVLFHRLILISILGVQLNLSEEEEETWLRLKREQENDLTGRLTDNCVVSSIRSRSSVRFWLLSLQSPGSAKGLKGSCCWATVTFCHKQHWIIAWQTLRDEQPGGELFCIFGCFKITPVLVEAPI